MENDYVVISKDGIVLENLRDISQLFLEQDVDKFYYGDNSQGLCCFVVSTLDDKKLTDSLDSLLGEKEFIFSKDFDLEKNRLRNLGYCPVIYQ